MAQTVAPSHPQHVPALLLRCVLLHTLFAEAKPSAFSRHHPSRCPLPSLNRLYPLPLLSACQNRPHVFLFPPCCCLATFRSLCEKKKKLGDGGGGLGGAGGHRAYYVPKLWALPSQQLLRRLLLHFTGRFFFLGEKLLKGVASQMFECRSATFCREERNLFF